MWQLKRICAMRKHSSTSAAHTASCAHSAQQQQVRHEGLVTQRPGGGGAGCLVQSRAVWLVDIWGVNWRAACCKRTLVVG